MAKLWRPSFGLNEFVSFVAVIVASTAAFAAVYQTRLMAKHQAVSVWPYIQMWAGINTSDAGISEEPPFSFNIANKGVGPAIIENIEVRRNGEKLSSLYELMTIVAKEKDLNYTDVRQTLEEANIDAGEVVEAGEIRWVVRSGHRDLALALGQEIYGTQSIEVDVCYCSLYEECWRLIYPAARPEAVLSCSF